MSTQPTTFNLEIPLEVAQQDVWELEAQLKHIAGITTDLRESKDIITAAHLFIQVLEPYIQQTVTIAGGIMATRDIAQIIYSFLHSKKQEVEQQPGKNKVVLITKGKRIELYNLTSEEIEHLLKP